MLPRLAPTTLHSTSARSRGVALVITLAFLALLSVIVVAFFMNVQTDLQSSNSYASSVTVKQLADTTSNIVMGQISDGTRGYEILGHPGKSGSGGGAVPDSGKRLAWTSQPGLIRTYDDAGLPGRSFKLYSSNNMVTPAGTEFNAANALDTEVPTNWVERSALFTDLNRPVVVSETDPNTGQITTTPNYPILDPEALGMVEGFNITGAPGANAASANAAPMPVRWMYVLADGTLTTPTDGERVASFAGVPAAAMPSKQNPIVGRVAFWTDDESCKLNINTASEGVFWDRPWADGNTERLFAADIPRQNEFHRYAGHPAVTSLSPVFGSIFPVTANAPTALDLASYLGSGTTRAQGSGLAPRVNVPTDIDANGVVRIKSERLYATTDELLFKPVVTGQERETFDMTKVNRAFLERSKFFLTANSRAPELNLAGKPRVGLWPVQVNDTERNAKDRLIAFCTTTSPGTSNESRYYFQRLSKYTGDGHTQYSTPTPSSQDPESDWTQIPRNQRIFAYLQEQTRSNIPGFGGSFYDKWGEKDRDQVLTQSFDYIRSSLNSYNTALEPKYDYLPTRIGYPHPGETQCIPITVTSKGPATLSEKCMGFGRSATITEAAIVFFRQNADSSDTSGVNDKLQAYLLLEPFNPSPGPPVWSPNLRFEIDHLDTLGVVTKQTKEDAGTTTSLEFPPVERARSLVTSRVGYSGSGHKAAFMGLQALLRVYSDERTDINKEPQPETGAVDEEKYYPYISKPISIPLPGPAVGGKTSEYPKLGFSGGSIVIRIYAGYQAGATQGANPQLVQTINLTFPPIDEMPWPTKDAAFSSMAMRMKMGSGSDPDALIRPTDVVRSVEASAVGATKGDLRMLAALPVVNANYFVAAKNYNSPSEPFAHSLRSSNGSAEIFLRSTAAANPTRTAAETKLIANMPYEPASEPVAARGLNGALMRGGLAGDWDNGPGNIEDGAYINKADEGNRATGSGTGAYYDRGSFGVESGVSFSPNRQIASAVSFGSLPIGVKRTRDAQDAGLPEGYPWQTLLFCRYPAAGDKHPGRTGSPRDHLYLDLFTMPIVEPYAISEPFSTAGKVNLNYQIVPFTYINRSTAMRGVLKSVKITAIPKGDYKIYKTSNGGDYRKSLNLDETLRGFENRFKETAGPGWIGDTGAFRSASEICDMFLVPETSGITLEKMNTFWSSNTLTGDNAREAPYGQIYPRVTTRSNTFTIHMRVQSLRKNVATAGNVWDEARDSVLSEYRGSTTVERYVDAADPKIPDFTANPEATMDSYYRFRVLGTKRFAP